MGVSWNLELEKIVSEFPPNLKQAMFAAANKGPIARGTWSHCAFNAAGDEIDAVANSVASAAAAFDVQPTLVSNFIRCWDSRKGTPEEVTERLKEAILMAGLFDVPTPGRRVVRQVVYKAAEADAIMELDAAGLIDNVDAAGELLGAV